MMNGKFKCSLSADKAIKLITLPIVITALSALRADEYERPSTEWTMKSNECVHTVRGMRSAQLAWSLVSTTSAQPRVISMFLTLQGLPIAPRFRTPSIALWWAPSFRLMLAHSRSSCSSVVSHDTQYLGTAPNAQSQRDME